MKVATGARQLHSAVGRSGSERTVRAMIATSLGMVPLVALFTDVRWLDEAFAAIVVVGGTAAILRIWQRPRIWHPLLGLVLLVPWLTWRFVSQHAFASFIPSAATLHDVSDLMAQVRHTTNNGVAPVHADHSITLLLAAVAGLLAAFIDLWAIVGRRPALAGVPLLVVFTVAGAVTRHPVSWVLFAIATVGFLILLSVNARDEVRDWGRLIPRAGEARPSAALGVSGPRIGVIAIAIAVLIPLMVPARPSNLLANALHHGNGTGDSGGIGTGGVSLDPFAALKGELQHTKPVDLFSVTVDQPTATPFYLRANVLTAYTDAGWQAAAHGVQESIGTTSFDTNPPTLAANTSDFNAHIDITGLSDNPPVFARPVTVSGVDPATDWSQSDQLLVGSTVHSGQQVSEDVSQPNPSIADLTAANDPPPQSLQVDLQVPATMPTKVRTLVTQITAGKTSVYGKARALSDFFTQPVNGFSYSLQTKAGDSGNALVDFLTNRTGFCQQFAAAMGIMLRMAGIPSRVVLGYTHLAPDQDGAFTVTSNNAHAWDEAFFSGIGWIPFDPTPIATAPGAATTDLAWAPHEAPGANSTGGISSAPSQPGARSATASSVPPGATTATGASGSARSVPWSLVWTLVGVLVVGGLAAAPGSVRWRRRLQRLRAARHGDPNSLWIELSDTATDLGYVWSAARTPRQVVGWLAPDVGRESAVSLQTLAAAVEHARYAPGGVSAASPALLAQLKDVESRLRSRRGAAMRIKSRVLPASLGWRLRSRAKRRH